MKYRPYVFNIGFNRSGTTSLSAALNMLDIPTAHYTIDESGWLPLMLRNKELEFVLQRNKKQNKRFFHGLDKKFKGFSDFGGEFYYKTLYRQYPNSKFILTLRPFEDWINSVVAMEKNHEEPYYDTEASEHARVKALENNYFTFKKEIREYFKDKPNSFLEIDICGGDGWTKLCNFLGKEIPTVPFPHKNKQ